MRVVHSCIEWAPITQGWLRDQIVTQFRLGANVWVAAKRRCGTERDLPVERVSCLSDLPRAVSLLERTKAALFDQYSFRNVSDLITKIDPLILHSHFANVAWQDLPAARRTGCSHVCSVYGYDIEQLPSHSTQWRKRYDLLAKRLHGVFCEGPHVKEVMVAQGFDPDRLFVNHLGVDLESLSFRPSTWDRKVPLRVLMAASFREKKGLPYGIDALDRFARDHPVELTIIGDAGPASEQKIEKRKIMASLEKATNISTVRLLGYQPHSRLVQETKSHHVFMQPSATASNGDTEGGAPVSLIEMQALGLPIVATKHCDIPNIVAPQYRENLAMEHDVDDLYKALARLVSESQDWESLTRHARTYVETHFDLPSCTENQLRLYQKLTEGG
ncbi:MAG: glycosyltransferase [Pseudomonadota bacterium]